MIKLKNFLEKGILGLSTSIPILPVLMICSLIFTHFIIDHGYMYKEWIKVSSGIGIFFMTTTMFSLLFYKGEHKWRTSFYSLLNGFSWLLFPLYLIYYIK
jgi:hypothetical protein